MNPIPRETWLALDVTATYLCRTAAPPERVSLEPWGIRSTRTRGELLQLAERCQAEQVWIHPSVELVPDPRYPGNLVTNERDAGSWWEPCKSPLGGYFAHVVRPGMETATTNRWRAAWDAPNAEVLAWALHFWAALAGLPFRAPSSTARLLLSRLLAPGRDPLGELGLPHHPEIAGHVEKAFIWHRKPQPEERDRHYLHAWDKHGQYLTAWSALELPLGHWREVQRPTFDETKRAGYWEIAFPNPPTDSLLPHPAGRGPAWVTTPTLQLLRAEPRLSGGSLEILRGHVWDRQRRALDPLYRTLRELRNLRLAPADPSWTAAAREGVQLAASAVKPVYTQFTGLMASPSTDDWDRSEDPWWRPEWRDFVTAAANAQMLRTLCRAADAGLQMPIAANVDCLYYASDDPELGGADVGLRCGDGLGEYEQREQCVPLPDYLTRADVSFSTAIRWLAVR